MSTSPHFLRSSIGRSALTLRRIVYCILLKGILTHTVTERKNSCISISELQLEISNREIKLETVQVARENKKTKRTIYTDRDGDRDRDREIGRQKTKSEKRPFENELYT